MMPDPWATVERIAHAMRYGSETKCRVLAMELLNLAREQRMVEETASERRPYRANPSLVLWANPGKVADEFVLSRRVYEVGYRHEDDGKDYRHEFATGVTLLLSPRVENQVVLWRPDGKRLWDDF